MTENGKIGLFKKDVKGREIYYFWYFKPDGTRAQKSTGQVVKQKALQVVSDLLADDYIFIQDHKLLFKQFAQDFWIKDTCPIYQAKLKRGKKLSSQYLLECRIVLDKYITPAFGDYRITDITPALIDTWLVNLPSSENLSHSRSNFCYVVLNQMLDNAVSRNLINKNPCTTVKRLYNNGSQRGSFTVSELTELFKSPWKEKYSYAACLLSATTGMRLGEIRALTRDRIKDDFIIVDRAWNNHEGFKSTKSGKTRYVPLHPAVKQVIENVSDFDLLFSCNGSFPLGPRRIAKPLVKHMSNT